MASWTKDSAIAELDALVGETTNLQAEQPFSEFHMRWYARCRTILEEIFGRSSRYHGWFKNLTWQEKGAVLFDSWTDSDPDSARREQHQEGYREDLGTARGILLAARDDLERRGLDDVYEGKDTAPESSAIVKVINLAEYKLRKVVRNQPGSEKEIQDAFENLLVGADLPYSRETDRIEYSSKTYQPDFTMPKLDLAIDVKFCGRDGREKEIIPEMNDDILAYQTKYGNILFVVYDIGLIRDVERFSSSFEQHQNVVVRVVKH